MDIDKQTFANDVERFVFFRVRREKNFVFRIILAKWTPSFATS